MSLASYPAILISLAALALSIYSVVERRHAAQEAERLRFTVIIDELNSLQLEHIQATTDLQTGDITAAINARRELLGAQALVLLRHFRDRITSPEYRTLAHALDRAGYPADADNTWRLAIEAADGMTQTLFAHRGYAYSLFASGRLDDARAQMKSALSAVGCADDTAQVHRITTLIHWSQAERDASPRSPIARRLRTEAFQATSEVHAVQIRQNMRKYLATTGERDLFERVKARILR